MRLIGRDGTLCISAGGAGGSRGLGDGLGDGLG